MLKSLNGYTDLGLFILRTGLGTMFMVAHGWPKLIEGPERWARVGGAMKNLGIDFAPQVWGLLAGCTEFFGGLLLVLGLFVRPASIALALVMVVASLSVFARAGSFMGNNAHPVEVGIAVLALVFLGAGRFSLDRKFNLS